MKRYPLGLPAWAFWVLAVLAAGIIGQIPAVGSFLTFAGLVAALIWFFVGVRPERDRRYADYAPVPVTGSERLLFDRLEVAGESHHVAAISRAVAIAGREMDAVLSWEPKNPHSQGGSAVRVDLLAGGERFTCGYIPSGISADLLPLVRAAAERGALPMIEATVFGGTAAKPNYGVLLGTGVRTRKVRFS